MKPATNNANQLLWGIPAKQIEITNNEINICKQFAINQFESINDSVIEYTKRNPTINIHKRIEYTTNGKIAEIAYAKMLNILTGQPITPDFNVYGKANKSFDADLSLNNMNYHIKSTHIYFRPEYHSWGFAKKDQLPTIHNNNDYLAPVVLDLKNDCAYCMTAFPIEYLARKQLFRPANSINPKMVAESMAYIYADDLADAIKNNNNRKE